MIDAKANQARASLRALHAESHFHATILLVHRQYASHPELIGARDRVEAAWDELEQARRTARLPLLSDPAYQVLLDRQAELERRLRKGSACGRVDRDALAQELLEIGARIDLMQRQAQAVDGDHADLWHAWRRAARDYQRVKSELDLAFRNHPRIAQAREARRQAAEDAAAAEVRTRWSVRVAREAVDFQARRAREFSARPVIIHGWGD